MEFDINKYSKILDKIDDNLNLYYNKYLDCTRFILYLSNDETDAEFRFIKRKSILCGLAFY